MSMKTKIKAFFGPGRQYVVTGASNNPNKFGFKILLWYVSHGLPVIPVNPREKEILDQEVVPSVSELVGAVSRKESIGSHKLGAVDGLSISFLTPPHITVATLKEIAAVDGFQKAVKGLWFQPGSYDIEALAVADELGFLDRLVHQDECILVRGEEGMYSANL